MPRLPRFRRDNSFNGRPSTRNTPCLLDSPVEINISEMITCEYESNVSMAKALELSDEGRVICECVYPHKVLLANKAWTKITGYEQHEVIGKTLKLLQGPLTDLVMIKQVRSSQLIQ